MAQVPVDHLSPLVDLRVSPDYRGGPITTRQYLDLPHRQQMIVDQYCAKLEKARKLNKK